MTSGLRPASFPRGRSPLGRCGRLRAILNRGLRTLEFSSPSGPPTREPDGARRIARRIHLAVGILWLGLTATVAGATETGIEAGAALYARHCLSCHGPEGRGDGPARSWLARAPRDLQSGFLALHDDDRLTERILDGRDLPIELDPEAWRQRARDTESVTSFLERLPGLPWEKIEAGSDLYYRRCATCHGLHGEAPSHVPEGVRPVRDLGDMAFQRAIEDDALVVAIRHGRDGMPALVPAISSGEAASLLAFVRLLSPGFTIYDQACASCHGDRGRGVGSLGEESILPTVVFDADYFQRTDRDTLRVNVWHMVSEQAPQMPHFAKDLTRAEVERILAYLKQRPAQPR